MLTHRKIFMIALDIENHLGLLYATVVSKETYAELDDLVYRKLVAWATHRHPKKYWHSIGR
jgi:hypothetical protein